MALLLHTEAEAQARLTAGDRVRLQAVERVFVPATGSPAVVVTQIGTLTRTSPDSLWLDVRTTRYALSRDDVITIDVARRRPRNAVRGAIIGGAITGVVLGWYGCEYFKNCDDPNTPSRESRLIGGIMPGAIIGALVARLWPGPERWVEGRARS